MKLRAALQHLASFRHVDPPTTPAALPITESEVAAWVSRESARAALKRETARALAYLDRFRHA